jgi:hypothetical protein
MVRKEVRFSDKVSVRVLPFEERQPAWEARHGPYVCAPKHDELWDGTAKAFRPKPLTTAELKRLRSDKRVLKVLPSSVFALYKRYRKKLPEEGRKEEEEEEEEVVAAAPLRRVESAPALPAAPDSLIERLTRTATGLFFSDAQFAFARARPAEKPLVGILKKPKEPAAGGAGAAAGSGGATKRLSLAAAALRRGSRDFSAQRRGSPMFMLGSSLEDTGEGAGEAKEEEEEEEELGSFDSADLADGVKWLESVHKLDGLSNTKVQRSASVQSTWEQLEEQWEGLKQLGQALIWDGQAKLNEVWPQNPLGAFLEPPRAPTTVH